MFIFSSLPRVVYLSPANQSSLGYSVTEYIPYNSYSRKIVGYLYAIQVGCRFQFFSFFLNIIIRVDGILNSYGNQMKK